jgi:hypothetical protein
MKILRILTTIFMALFGGVMLAFAGLPFLPSVAGLLLFSYLIPRQHGVLNVSLFDLARPSGSNIGGGGGIDSEIILIPEENVELAQFPARTTNGGAIEGNIVLKSDKYMHRFYMTQGTIKPTCKKVKGANIDCGGYEVGVEGFFPGLEEALLDWISSFGFAFKGFVIVQNCSNSKKYLLGEPCNLVYVDDLEAMWGEEVDKEKGVKFIFKGNQSQPMCIYEGAVSYDHGSSSW